MTLNDDPEFVVPSHWNDFEPEITIVVGAGASKGFNFPVTAEIKQDLIDQPVLYKNKITEVFAERPGFSLARCGEYVEQLLKDFSRELRLSGKDSIDAFLERRADEFGELGKLVIASRLLPVQESLIQKYPGNDPWHLYLYNQYLSAFDDWAEVPVAFVVFNYDQALELSLFLARAHSHGSDEYEAAWAEVNKLRILHVYGTLGTNTNPTVSDDRHHVVIGAATELRRLSDARKQIKVIDDRDLNASVFRCATSWVVNCRKLVFLGFAMDNKNLERIGLPANGALKLPRDGVYATAMGLPGMAKQRLESAFALRAGVPDPLGQCVFGRTHEACREFLSEYVF